jgi:hypothetical protein
MSIMFIFMQIKFDIEINNMMKMKPYENIKRGEKKVDHH